ncbi:hypothetical protein [Jeotgalibaca ciconiae]|uniref:Glycine zipper family protein n=1 Tax=Jeotgalibaca ciconiae TaxID=2496265 RepID=A0A3S9H7I1_9LACT|nr:hypothetical protein [Jeotgalibaca ciconiae]AZP03306.1 hypothetical protein EJN90_00715 [Jeotgalibaca ciconiae]HJB23377.1 hypothetical protein [Candidatus Jeotgalibaca pullicola]
MAKRKGRQIQRKNIQVKAPKLYDSLGKEKEIISQEEQEATYENTFLFTIIGMFVGMLIGYFLDNMALGFGIGILIGGMIDSILNTARKKKFEAELAPNQETSKKN